MENPMKMGDLGETHHLRKHLYLEKTWHISLVLHLPVHLTSLVRDGARPPKELEVRSTLECCAADAAFSARR